MINQFKVPNEQFHRGELSVGKCCKFVNVYTCIYLRRIFLSAGPGKNTFKTAKYSLQVMAFQVINYLSFTG